MNPRKENAPTAIRASFETKLKPNYKRFPAYGKQFLELRRAGKIPSLIVMVVFDWDLAQAYPRIVIADETPVDQLNFIYLAGLAVQLVYRPKDAHRAADVVNAILEVNPSCRATFAIDLIETGNAACLIKPYQKLQIAEAA